MMGVEYCLKPHFDYQAAARRKDFPGMKKALDAMDLRMIAQQDLFADFRARSTDRFEAAVALHGGGSQVYAWISTQQKEGWEAARILEARYFWALGQLGNHMFRNQESNAKDQNHKF